MFDWVRWFGESAHLFILNIRLMSGPGKWYALRSGVVIMHYMTLHLLQHVMLCCAGTLLSSALSVPRYCSCLAHHMHFALVWIASVCYPFHLQ